MCGLSAGAVNQVLQRAARAGVARPLPADLAGERLEERLYGRPTGQRRDGRRETLDCGGMHQRLSRCKSLMLRQLWREYREAEPEKYGSSQFCELYREWKAWRAPAMLQEHQAGEKLFVDYAGQTVPGRAPEGGEERAAQVFMAVLGASSYCYSEASWGQDVESWLGAWRHLEVNLRRCEKYWQGQPEAAPTEFGPGRSRSGRPASGPRCGETG